MPRYNRAERGPEEVVPAGRYAPDGVSQKLRVIYLARYEGKLGLSRTPPFEEQVYPALQVFRFLFPERLFRRGPLSGGACVGVDAVLSGQAPASRGRESRVLDRPESPRASEGEKGCLV